MAVTMMQRPYRYIGLSTDTKPADVPVGSTFFETDTGALYITNNDGTNWHFKADPEPYLYRIAEGKIAGKTAINRIAYNPTLSSSAVIAPSDPASYSWITTAAGIQPVVVSSDAQDSADVGAGAPGTGVNSVTVTYLDADHVEQTEDVTLDGTTEVTMTADDVFRINNVQTKTVGTGGSAAGNISVLDGSGGNMIGYIAVGNNCNRVGVYTVPADKELYITSVKVSGVHGAANKRAIIRLSGIASGVFTTRFETAMVQDTTALDLDMPLVFPEKTDILWRGVSDGTATVHIFMSGWLEG